MKRYFKPVTPVQEDNSGENQVPCNEHGPSKRACTENIAFSLDNLPGDPGLRPNILDYPVNIRDQVRRVYLQKGPCQPKTHDFPWTESGGEKRRFISSWFEEEKYSRWLEYSTDKDVAFCLFCYLFKPEHGGQSGGDSFVTEGFSNWRKKSRLDRHIGGATSMHNKCLRACDSLMNQEEHIDVALNRQSDQLRKDYYFQLNAIIDCIRFLIQHGLSFRGHDESKESKNPGTFLGLLKFLADHNESINNVVLKNARGNLQLTAPSIQKDIVEAAASETLKVIISEIKDEFFSIMVDDSRDISVREQMAVCLRYVNKEGCVIERFIGIVHVAETTAETLKKAIEWLFSRHGLSMSSLRGQGYDGASNMQGAFKGLKTLIMKENKCAYFVHCFAHQLQLTLVAVAKKHIPVGIFFGKVTNLVNMSRVSCKRRDTLRDKQVIAFVEKLSHGDITTGKGLNQETSLIRAGDTRWSSHFDSLISVICNFSAAVGMLEEVVQHGTVTDQKCEASDLLNNMQSFDFVFMLHLMKSVLGITHELSQALQRKDQDIINAMNLVKLSKIRLQQMRDDKWTDLLDEVFLFCENNDIVVPKMEDIFFVRGRSRRQAQELTNLHHYQVELFYSVIDMQLQELQSRFNEVNTELLTCLASLDPRNSFSKFDLQKLVKFAKFYPIEFPPEKLLALDNQLQTYIMDVTTDSDFAKVEDIASLAKELVKRQKDKSYPLVYLLIKLALILPVATATVERAFSAMKIIKTPLRNRMEDDWMNALMVTYIERDVFDTIDNERIMRCFQDMKNRRGQLPQLH